MKLPGLFKDKAKTPPDRGPGSRGPNRGPGNKHPIGRAGLGLLYLAIGKRQGFDDFGNTTDAYLASLAPLVAFDLVFAVLRAATGDLHAAFLTFFVFLCVILMPAVVSHPICRRWGAAENWPRYVNILNWAQMLMFLVPSLGSAVARLSVEAGAPALVAEKGLLLATIAYALWFQWFVARGVLQMARWRTLALLLSFIGVNSLLVGALLLTAVRIAVK